MIPKLLLTAAIIAVVLMLLRQRAADVGNAPVAGAAGRRRRAGLLAAALVLLSIAISAAIFYGHWQERHRIFVVHVINGVSGAEQSYHVYQQDIDGRSFRTIDGRHITLADSERMEVRAQDGGGVLSAD